MRIGTRVIAMVPSLIKKVAFVSGNRKVGPVAARSFAACAPLNRRPERFIVRRLPEDPDDRLKLLLLLSCVAAIASSRKK